MATQEVYLTAEGAQKLQAELEHLKKDVRRELAQRLHAAIQQGDLSENADYIAAKEQQGFVEGRIQELEQALRNVVIIEENGSKDGKVAVGSTITVQEDGFTPETYYLVGPREADPNRGRISYESPIGQALLEHQEGDSVDAQTPGGSIHLKILKVA
jgi:transcription elongation factor GreA